MLDTPILYHVISHVLRVKEQSTYVSFIIMTHYDTQGKHRVKQYHLSPVHKKIAPGSYTNPKLNPYVNVVYISQRCSTSIGCLRLLLLIQTANYFD